MMPIWVVILLVGVVIPGFWCISISNRFTRLEKLVEEAWADVDVALKRRHDLIPNLVETVKAYAEHEKDVLEAVLEARDRAVKGYAQEESELARAVSAVMLRTERYPDLKASENFVALQHELANSEDRIAAARRFYNANVREFNILLSAFPSRLMAAGRPVKAFYVIDGIDLKTVPQMNLTGS